MQLLQQNQHSRPNAEAYVNSLNKSADNVQVKSAADGHYYMPVAINGKQIKMMADTGASAVFLNQSDAKSAGINVNSLSYNIPYDTANGTIYAAETTIPSLNVNGIIMQNVPVTISPKNGTDVSLLGMSFFNKLKKYEVNDGVMTLYK